MPVTDVTHDLDARPLTIAADFAAPPKQIREVYADPSVRADRGTPDLTATFVSTYAAAAALQRVLDRALSRV